MKPLKPVKPVRFQIFHSRSPFIPTESTGWIFKPTKESGTIDRTENYPDTGDSKRKREREREREKKYAVSYIYIFFLSVDQREMKFPVVLGGLP